MDPLDPFDSSSHSMGMDLSMGMNLFDSSSHSMGMGPFDSSSHLMETDLFDSSNQPMGMELIGMDFFSNSSPTDLFSITNDPLNIYFHSLSSFARQNGGIKNTGIMSDDYGIMSDDYGLGRNLFSEPSDLIFSEPSDLIFSEPSVLNLMGGCTNSNNINGIVKWFNHEKGYGFITSLKDKEDYYFNIKGIKGAKLPKAGDYVNFIPRHIHKRLRATHVQIVQQRKKNKPKITFKKSKNENKKSIGYNMLWIVFWIVLTAPLFLLLI